MKIPDAVFWTLVGMGIAATINLFGVQDSIKRAICTPKSPALILWVK